MSMTNSVLMTSLALAGMAALAQAADTPMAPAAATGTQTSKMATKEPHADMQWLRDADTAGNAEVAAADLALAKAQRADVKQFAQMMKDAHTQANRELADLATKKNVALPAKKPSDHGLDDKSGADFDTAYLKQQVTAHEKAEKLFEKGTKSSDADIRAWAEKTLPVVREHLTEARKLAGMPPSK